MKYLVWTGGLAALTLLSAAVAQNPQDRQTKVLGDRQKVTTQGFWIYNDLPRALGEARLTGKPVLVTFRCIPCEHCAQLDETVVERDPKIQKLLEQFVCLRIVHANGMDLSLFQYDYDQSWTAFFLNADQTIYGRYGTRSHRTESANDMSLDGFAQALQGALDLHRLYPKNKTALAAKRGEPAAYASPEDYPSLKGRYGSKLDYEGKVVQSCIHCHQVREAQRLVFRDAGQPIPDRELYPYPHPRVLGLVPDPLTRATLKSVSPGSAAEKDGFRAGDEILSVERQPILSTADIQWVLHHAGPSGSLKVEVRRAGKIVPLTLTLAPGWRQKDDITWRASSWDLRRMTTGGLVLEEATPDQRREAGLGADALALKVKSVGQYGPHAAAKQAGFQQGDLFVAVDGRSERMSEGGMMVYLAQHRKPGEKVPVTVVRGGQRVELQLPMQ